MTTRWVPVGPDPGAGMDAPGSTVQIIDGSHEP